MSRFGQLSHDAVKARPAARVSGFTLIEIVAVLAIMGLLALAAVLWMTHPSAQQRLEGYCQALQACDVSMRSAARQGGRAQHLEIDLNRDLILWRSQDDDVHMQVAAPTRGYTLELQTCDGRSSEGQNSISCSSEGLSETYALHVQDEEEEDRWMIVAGLSGQVCWTNDEKQIDAIFDSVRPKHLAAQSVATVPGLDAH